MIDEAKDDSNPLERVPTGLPGLDTVLNGGLFRGGVYMLLAPPGSGKTMLGNHISFRHVASGGRAVYVTLLAESHSRMLAVIRQLAFFEPSCVGSTLTYVSAYDALEKGKLKGLMSLLRSTIRDQKATFLVLDGLVTMGAVAESELETKRFINELQVFVELVGCTTLLLTGANPSEQYALRTMVDGLFELRVDSMGMEVARVLEVTKFRGGPTLLGRHLFEISDAGVTVHPRTESLRGRAPPSSVQDPVSSVSFGIGELDRMLDGGPRSDSISAIVGAPGSGKTLLGLSFLAAGAGAREKGLYFGFFESPRALRRKADAIGIRLSDHVKSGALELMWQAPRAAMADSFAEKLLEAARARGVRRIFIDGLDGFKDSLFYPMRTRQFVGALCDELRSMGVVTLLSDQTESLSGVELPERGLTAMLDNVICLRHVETRSKLRKYISVVKMREGAGDSSSHELVIDRRGITVLPASRATPPAPAARVLAARSRRGKVKVAGKIRR